MAKYLVSFRIHSDSTYDKRYENLHATLDSHGSAFWNADTSLIAMESASSIDAIGQACKAVLSAHDLLIIREIGFNSTRYINEPGEGFLYFFPEAKKL